MNFIICLQRNLPYVPTCVSNFLPGFPGWVFFRPLSTPKPVILLEVQSQQKVPLSTLTAKLRSGSLLSSDSTLPSHPGPCAPELRNHHHSLLVHVPNTFGSTHNVPLLGCLLPVFFYLVNSNFSFKTNTNCHLQSLLYQGCQSQQLKAHNPI